MGQPPRATCAGARPPSKPTSVQYHPQSQGRDPAHTAGHPSRRNSFFLTRGSSAIPNVLVCPAGHPPASPKGLPSVPCDMCHLTKNEFSVMYCCFFPLLLHKHLIIVSATGGIWNETADLPHSKWPMLCCVALLLQL